MSRAFLAFVICAGFLVAQPGSQVHGCTIEITAPAMGTTVSDTEPVSGRAEIPSGRYLWVFAHRKGLALWWPQGGGAAPVKNDLWEALVTFGQDRDSGAQFEVTAIAVDEKTNNDLNAWFQKADTTGNYSGMRLPNSSCIARTLVLTRR